MVFELALLIKNDGANCDTTGVRAVVGVIHIVFDDNQQETRMSRDDSCIGMVLDWRKIVPEHQLTCS